MNTRGMRWVRISLMAFLILWMILADSSTIRVLGEGGEVSGEGLLAEMMQLTERVSVASDGTQGNGMAPAISGDGRYVAFGAFAENLVEGDTNSFYDVFVHDRQTGETERVSVASDGEQGNGESGYYRVVTISSDGRYVAFYSWATNLVDADTNDVLDVFVHDRQTGETGRVSVSSDGEQGDDGSSLNSISGDGRYVAFVSKATNLVDADTNNFEDVFVHDRQTGNTERVSVSSEGIQANDSSSFPSISADGRYVAYFSYSTNLVEGDTNQMLDVFVHDRQTGATERVSVTSDGNQANNYSTIPYISADGRYIAFLSKATNLVEGDTNNIPDVFVHDRQTGVTERVSVSSDGRQGNSGYLRLSISGDGRYVAFDSTANNLVDGDKNRAQDVFVHDRFTGRTFLVSVTSDGVQGDGNSSDPSISGDGRNIVFASYAANLVEGDTNAESDVFVHWWNTLPQAGDDSATTLENTPVEIDVLANDLDEDGDGLNIAEVGAPAHGTAAITGTVILYTPEAGYIGSDDFTYTISDGLGGEATANVSVFVARAGPVIYLPLTMRE